MKSLKASKGRSRYLGGKEVGHPDSGCELIKEVIEGLRNLNIWFNCHIWIIIFVYTENKIEFIYNKLEYAFKDLFWLIW